MPDALIPLDMGFAEFAAKLIAEVFEAIANSTTDQEERYADLVKAASLTPDEYASRIITADQTTAELARLFPTRQAGQPHAIFTGAPYKPAGRNRAEQPPVNAALGVTLEAGDFVEKAKGTLTLTSTGVAKIARAASLSLAEAALTSLQRLVARGVQRVIVDSGRVNAKLAFSVVRTDDEPARSGFHLVSQLKPLGSLPGISLPKALSNVRLVVRQPEQATVTGEVEITFKTIA